MNLAIENFYKIYHQKNKKNLIFFLSIELLLIRKSYMNFKKFIKKIQISLNFGTILKFITKRYKEPFYDSLFSSILRLIFNYKKFFQLFCFLKSSTDLKSFNEFWNVYIGFKMPRNYLIHIRFDNYISNNPYCCTNLKKLPVESNSCQMIYIKHFFSYFPGKNYSKIINSWKNKLIPGGFLKIQINLLKNPIKFKNLKKTLQSHNFYLKKIDDFDFEINGTITIIAVNEENLKSLKVENTSQKTKEVLNILKSNKKLFLDKSKLCLIGLNSNYVKKNLIKLGYNEKIIVAIEKFELLKDFSNNSFDGAVIFNLLEYHNYSFNKGIFDELKRVIIPNADILLIVPEKKNYIIQNSVQLFDKGILTRILDENNIDFEWIYLSSTLKTINSLLKNKESFPLDKSGTKIFLLGVYSLRYTFLNNSRWDNQIRAFEKLGYNIKVFDIKEHSFFYIIRCIEKYKPDILWIGGKTGYDFLKLNAQYFRDSTILVIYWMWDITYLKPFDFNDVIDYMFITSTGEIQDYKRKFNLKNIYYMPASIVPEIIHRNNFIKKKYDIGFAGRLNKTHPWYKERSENLEIISKFYNVKIFKDVYNNLTEYYSQCKIVFGGTPYFKNLELYASNRPFVAMGCGSCFITNYFKGLEKLAENKKHLLWYETADELLEILKIYLYNDDLREKIQYSAEKLIREKHNYIIRIKNMMDIINGTSKNFHGFIT